MKNNIYIVLHTLSVGGAERHASSIANYLCKKGYSVKIVLIDNDTVSYKLNDSIEVVCLPNTIKAENTLSRFENVTNKINLKFFKIFSNERYSYFDKYLFYKLRYADKLATFFPSQKDIESSIVLSFMPTPNISCAIAKEKCKCKFKLILGEFSSPHLEFSADAPENKMKRKFFPNAEGFVFQTDEQMSFYDYLPDVEKTIIPNPIEKISVEPYSGVRKKEIVNFCRLAPAKNIQLLVNAFAKLHIDYPDYKLVIYGDGPERSLIDKSISEHLLNDAVEIRPFAQNVLELVRESAMFVSSSNREGISNSMLEAMAIGLPTICTDCPAGGARMMIRSYENGLLVPVNDVYALYEAMKYMIEHPDAAAKMGENAVYVREILEKEKILNKWCEFVEEIRRK